MGATRSVRLGRVEASLVPSFVLDWRHWGEKGSFKGRKADLWCPVLAGREGLVLYKWVEACSLEPRA